MNQFTPVQRLINRMDPAKNCFLNTTFEDAEAAVASGDPERVGKIDGQFAIMTHRGKTVRMARSIGRPMRYFLAKQASGPLLVVAERMDQLYQTLQDEGIADQFHPSYTRMVPAHHLMELSLIGCPDPNPVNRRYFDPDRNRLAADAVEIGQQYIGALAAACDRWLSTLPKSEPIGVLFSGGIDSGALLVTLNHVLLQRGESPARLKAFTLAVDGNASDFKQASDFLRAVDLEMLLEVVDVPAESIDYRGAIRVIEDYKPLDVQSATMALALCRAIRERYPDWKYLIDGDGGDENLKDYPIEENPELTIRSVLNNSMLYQEGWGVDAIKHSLVYTGGQSRGHVRTFAPADQLGFEGFSPFAVPSVIRVAEGIPFIEMTGWDHDRLYALKGDICRAGVEIITGTKMPTYPKCRFQRGAVSVERFGNLFPDSDTTYREAFQEIFSDESNLKESALAFS